MAMRWSAVPFVLLIFLVTAVNALADDEARMQWDIIRVDISTTPPTIAAGGTNKSAAVDESTISLTGSGTFVVGEADEVTGGGTWKAVASDGTTTTGT